MSILATLLSLVLEIFTVYFGIKLYVFLTGRKAMKSMRKAGEK